ncbi:ABC-2 family transporter protein [Rubripirellula tenax]|uniref:ABC-2 family transporter protein n=1 Tax=Rubripirellula tenax TaxID=2528015 RepID=A0A5C6EJI7_9BACT|nr:ABC transporter permease [Rubripirellula tenax]TWU47439.1 ABC-2 family transporter protein [Rubripirellula tenax]
MIWTVIEVSLRRLLHNKVELLLTFVVPIAFFSIFAMIFGGGIGGGTTPKIKVVAVDEFATPASRDVIASLRDSVGLRFMRDADVAIDRPTATEMVRRGSVTMAIVLRERDGELSADLLADSSDQIASQVATALVARSLMIVKADQQAFSLDTASLNAAISNEVMSGEVMGGDNGQLEAEAPQVPAELETEVTPVQVIDVIGQGKVNPVISMYAAGIAVMFLLFGATGGGGSFLEERENQTLDRLLSTQLSMDQLLLGKWFYMTCIGTLQVTVMFVWAQVVFGVDLMGHVDGFVMMTLVTASAAAAFGLFLATLCKTRGQLNGLSVILVLSMSALGGSMVPRYVMSDRLREYGLITFNAWALDGYDKVFWRELPVASLAPQLSVLLVSGVVMLVAARLLAIRWEAD